MRRPLAIVAWLVLVAVGAGARAQGPEPSADTGANADSNADSNTNADSNANADPDESEPGPASDPDAEDELPEEHRPALTLEVDTGEDGVRTGDVVRVVITAEVPEGSDVAVPEQELGTFEIFAHRYTDEAVESGRRRRFRFELDLLVLEPGEQELPAIRLRVVTADGTIGTVRTEARTIEVGAHLGNEPDAQPRPPTQPVPVLEEDLTLLWVLIALGVIAVVALLSFFAARWWSRRPAAAKPAPPPRPPWEVALEKLDALKREKASLIAEEKQVELVDRVSDALREYLGGRYDFNGLESTSDEVVARLRKVKLRGIKLEHITALLSDSDLVKFAKAVPDEAQCDRMLEGAIRIVRATTPRPEATPIARPPSDGAGARIVTREGEVTLPISARSIEEAEREIRAAVGAAFRDVGQDPSFEGTLRVVLSAALAPSASATDALRRLHARLSSELQTVPLPGGRRARIVLEHLHARPTSDGAAVTRTVLDDTGVRVEGGPPAAPIGDANANSGEIRSKTAHHEPVSRDSSAGSAPHGRPEIVSGERKDDTRGRESGSEHAERDRGAAETPDPSTGTPTHGSVSDRSRSGEPTHGHVSDETRSGNSADLAVSRDPQEFGADDKAAVDAGQTPLAALAAATPRTRTGPASWASAAHAAQVGAASAPDDTPRARTKTGPVEWDRAASASASTDTSAHANTNPSANTGTGSGTGADANARVLERLLPALAPATPEASVLLRWVTGIERPVTYLDDGEPMTTARMMELGLTRGGLHERALANLRGAIPPGFAPGDEPALLDDEGAALLALPALVPAGHAWIAYPLRGEGLVVLMEGAASTAAELERLERAHQALDAPLFARPVRVTARGFTPLDWPSQGRPTDPGFAAGGSR